MGYRPQIGSPRSAGRGHEGSQRRKQKARKKKRRSSDRHLLESNYVPTVDDVVEKTLGRLRSLGNQTFGIFPFDEYFDDWLANLRDVVSDFESSSGIDADNQFINERSQTISNIERELEKRRPNEATHDRAVESLSHNRSLLEQINEEYAARTKEIEERKNGEIKRLSRNVQGLKEELDRIAQTKVGIFRSISKEAKAQKESEAARRLNSAQSELKLTVQNLTLEQEKLRNEHEKRKQFVIEQMQNLGKEIENLELDGSLESRRVACESLANSVKTLLERKNTAEGGKKIAIREI